MLKSVRKVLLNPRSGVSLASHVHLQNVVNDAKAKLENLRGVRPVANVFKLVESTPSADLVPVTGDMLWGQSQTLINDAYNTVFIQGIQDSRLDPTHFGQYTLDDAIFCYYCIRNWNLLVVKAQQEQNPNLAAFCQAEVTSYTNYYNSMAVEWHVADPEAIKLSDAAQTYINFQAMVAGAQNVPVIYSLITMMPCERLWPYLSYQMSQQQGPFQPPALPNLYATWITDNASDHRKIETTFNALAAVAAAEGQDISDLAAQLYSAAMQCERDFFRSGGGEPVPPPAETTAKFLTIKMITSAAKAAEAGSEVDDAAAARLSV